MVVVVVEGDVGSVVVLEVDMVGGTDAQLQSHPLKTKHSSQLLGVGSERSFSVVSEHRVSLLVIFKFCLPDIALFVPRYWCMWLSFAVCYMNLYTGVVYQNWP
jgi:hypothetical protein